MKKRVFAYVEDNSKRGKPSAILALDETGERLFRYEVDDRGEPEDYEEQLVNDRNDSPAAVAFAAFERFCREECGLKDCNDEVILAEDKNIPPKTLADYVDFRLGAMDWAVVEYIGSNYRLETAHLKDPLPFGAFRRVAQGMPEPYATRRVYQKYREEIHKDAYTAEEIDRMENYIFTHLDAIYRRHAYDADWRIAHSCAAIFRSDRARFLHVVERIVADHPRRRTKKKREKLMWFLSDVSDLIFCEGEIDLSALEEEEKKPPIEREEYAIFRELSPDALELVKELIEEYETQR